MQQAWLAVWPARNGLREAGEGQLAAGKWKIVACLIIPLDR